MSLPDGPCSNCGHMNGAVCSECGREMVCGRAGRPCPVEGCIEGVLPEPSADLHFVDGNPVEHPRKVAGS